LCGVHVLGVSAAGPRGISSHCVSDSPRAPPSSFPHLTRPSCQLISLKEPILLPLIIMGKVRQHRIHVMIIADPQTHETVKKSKKEKAEEKRLSQIATKEAANDPKGKKNNKKGSSSPPSPDSGSGSGSPVEEKKKETNKEEK
jgi:hypothetical protein